MRLTRRIDSGEIGGGGGIVPAGAAPSIVETPEFLAAAIERPTGEELRRGDERSALRTRRPRFAHVATVSR